jgi:hypothetical protein
MSKFLLNLLLQISKPLINSKKSNFNSEISFFPDFRPGRPHGPLGLWPSPPTGRAIPEGRNCPGRPIQPTHRSRLRGKYIFLFGSRLPEPTASPSSLCQAGPACQLYLPHHAGRPQPLSPVTFSHPAPPDLRPHDARQGNYPTP